MAKSSSLSSFDFPKEGTTRDDCVTKHQVQSLQGKVRHRGNTWTYQRTMHTRQNRGVFIPSLAFHALSPAASVPSTL